MLGVRPGFSVASYTVRSLLFALILNNPEIHFKVTANVTAPQPLGPNVVVNRHRAGKATMPQYLSPWKAKEWEEIRLSWEILAN